MSPAQFKRWRKSLGLSQKEAAVALGLKRRILQYYEKGERNNGENGSRSRFRRPCGSPATRSRRAATTIRAPASRPTW